MNGEQNKLRNRLIATFITAGFIIFLFYLIFRPQNEAVFVANADTQTVPQASVLFVGDMMLDRNVRNTINKNGFDNFFSGVKDLIKNADIAVANLEGPFTNNPSLTASLVNKNLVFTFDPALAPQLYRLGFDVLGLANNHSYNFGKDGLESTRRYIGSAGMLYYGDPFNKDEISTIITKNGIKIGLIGFHEFYYTNFDNVLSEITRLRKDVDVLIVNPHWGVEYQANPTELQSKLAHQFIDLGADVVIGAHPHIVGDIEMYKGKKIYYSLGNFAFDQYFSEATMNGLGVVLNIKKEENGVSLEYKDVPLRVDRDGVRIFP